MLRTIFFLLSLMLSAGLVIAFGFAALAVCFGLCLLTVVFSSAGVDAELVDLPTATRPAPLLA